VNGKGATLIDQAQLNAKEEAKWRAEFEKLGREAVSGRVLRAALDALDARQHGVEPPQAA
jgi:hypothetical protein